MRAYCMPALARRQSPILLQPAATLKHHLSLSSDAAHNVFHSTLAAGVGPSALASAWRPVPALCQRAIMIQPQATRDLSPPVDRYLEIGSPLAPLGTKKPPDPLHAMLFSSHLSFPLPPPCDPQWLIGIVIFEPNPTATATLYIQNCWRWSNKPSWADGSRA